MSEKDVRRISQIAPVDEVVPPVFKPEPFIGKDLLLVNMEKRTGDMSDYYLLTVQQPDTGEEVLISYGGFKAMAQLDHLTPNDLPIMICFRQSGRSLYLD